VDPVTEPDVPTWTYTLCDMRSGEELAVLPLTQVKYTRQLNGVGSLDAYLHLADAKVRELQPWAATQQRRTTLYAEYGVPGDQRCVWGGVVTARHRPSSSSGMSLTCVSWEGWLYRQRLLLDLELTDTMRGTVDQLVRAAQFRTDLGLRVDTGDPGPDLYNVYLVRDVKPVLELVDDLGTSTETPLEYLVESTRDPDTGVFVPVMRLGIPRLGRRYEDTQLTYQYPDGALTAWELVEDGSAASNILTVLGSGSGDTQPWFVMEDEEAGVDELGFNYPTWASDLRLQDTDDWDLMHARAAAALRAGKASEYVFSGVTVRAEEYLGQVSPGDDVGLEITHPSLEEYPQAVTNVTRVLGESVTVGDGGQRDQVSLTVGGTP